MINLNHREFDPAFNRIYNQPTSDLHPRTQQHTVDPEDPYRPIHTGVYTDTVEGRDYVFCVPSTVKPSASSRLISSAMTAASALRQSAALVPAGGLMTSAVTGRSTL